MNRVSFPPTAVLICGSGLGLGGLARLIARRPARPADDAPAFLSFMVLITFAGHAWFLVSFFNESKLGNTIKPSYILHVFPVPAILGAEFLMRKRRRAPLGFRLVLGGLILVAMHNLPVCFTRYVQP